MRREILNRHRYDTAATGKKQAGSRRRRRHTNSADARWISLLHRREGGWPQDRDRHLLHDRAVLLALGEHPNPFRVLGERVELGHALVEALPRQQVGELVIVAAHAVQPVTDLAEP